MRSRAFSAGVVALCLAATLGACRRAADSSERGRPPAAGAAAAASWSFPVLVHPDLPEYRVELRGDAAASGHDDAIVRSIEIHRAGSDQPVQTIEDLEAALPTGMLLAGQVIDVIDMNFDGYSDFRMVEHLPAGPNLRYRNWLYDTESRAFASAEILDRLTAALFDAGSKQVLASERVSANRYLTETYEYSGDRLVLVRRRIEEYLEPGRVRVTVSEPRGGEMQVVDEHVVDKTEG